MRQNQPVGEASLTEGLRVELGEGSSIEGVLKVLKGESVLEDSGI
jgi:hypothetical protein